jgi:spermidine synthase
VPLLVAATFLSGAAALVFEVLWVRELGSVLGTTTVAVNVVLTAFFLGMGLGARLFGGLADRTAAPLRVFVALELVVAGWGLAFRPMCGIVRSSYLAMAPAEWSAGPSTLAWALVALVLLLPPTLCMGGTLPLLVRAAGVDTGRFARRLSVLYGANTVGAALGVFASVHVLMPRAGIQGAATIAASCNLGAALLAALGARGVASGTSRIAHPGRDPAPVPPPQAATPTLSRRSASVVLLGASAVGFLSVGLEVLWTRALSTRFLSTVYSFATILFAYLLCLGVGSLVAVALDRRHGIRRDAAACLVTASGVSVLGAAVALAGLPALRSASADGYAELGAAELLQALGVLLVPTGLFGLLYPVFGRLLLREGRPGESVGRLALANTLGAAAAPIVFGFLLVPHVGVAGATKVLGWLAVLLGVGVLMPWSGALARPAGRLVAVAAVAAAALLTFVMRDQLSLWRDAPGDVRLYARDGVAASVAVVRTHDGDDVLKIDNSYRLGSSRSAFGQARQGLLPLVLAREARSALFVGLATGGSVGPAAAAFPATRVDIVEIVPGLSETLRYFAGSNAGLEHRIATDPDVRLLEVDGRHFVRATDRRYDVIVGDLFVPWRAGEGGMYTREHFQAVRGVLSDGGVFWQWLPLYQLRTAELKIIVATFCDAFPTVEALWLYLNAEQPVLGLAGSSATLVLSESTLAGHARDAECARRLRESGLDDPRTVYALWVADRAALAAWSADAPRETEGHPRIEFAAPRSRFSSPTPPACESVAAVLALAERAGPPTLYADPAMAARLEPYRRAIAHFFRAERGRLCGGRPEAGVAELSAAMHATPDWDWIAWNLERAVQRALDRDDGPVGLAAAQALQASTSYRFLGLHYEAVVRSRAGDHEAARSLAEAARVLAPGFEPTRALLSTLEARGGAEGR